MNVVLHSTHCPKCKVLESKLKKKSIYYKENNDVEIMVQKGFLTVPMLEVDGKTMNFTEANAWINEQ